MGKVKQQQQLFEEQKLQTLCEIEGFEKPEHLINEFFNSGTVPGICMNPGCDASYLYEPDQERGWCDECETNTVKSCLILYGIV